ncbi:hypothetical protein CHLNCDRAFT_143086 [Chlorella variabilis]|uniref:membrane dipeptidase n=1 Tax=Chlorella variabilis TaxID=554065 RepID=E1Z9F2_CHLVA|nr:hypothetical protein CHLNCDRAFT_143086 [Chlorella variabilis]EFN57508.1 hypothetical protein CHLNCDRAFT_143086 [Chlorella variabilis]|eukprot:XP_005849610.1 hypothetical protein CHLNCDRAFT_143086 [Chlorella variabilis]
MAARALLSLVLLLLSGALRPAAACTSYIVGPGASADGSVLIARNDDGEGAIAPSWLVYHPPRPGPAPYHANLNNLSLELPAPGLAYFALPSGPLADAATGRNTSGEAAGWNSAGVAVSATESIYSSVAALAADPMNEGSGIIEDAIPSILLPQATSARQAVRVLGDLVTLRGAGEAFGVLAADAEDAWYLEVASGHHWLAQREVDLEDQDSVLASPGLLNFAVEAGLYDPGSGRPFNFFAAFMRDGPHDVNYSYPRVCLLQRLFGACPPAANCANMLAQPTFMRPTPHKLGVRDVKAAMRNHWDGSAHDPYLHGNPDEPWRPIALLRTSMGHVTQVRPAAAGLPDALSIITHVTFATPKLAPFIPLYKGLPGDAVPRELTVARAGQPDAVSLFWRARRLQALVFQDWGVLAPPAAAAIVRFEERVEQELCPAFEARYVEALGAGREEEAARELVDFTAWVVQEAGALLDRLAAKAAKALGLPGVPEDARMLEMLEEAAEAYAFEPTSDALPAGARLSGAPGQRGVGGGTSTA